MNERILLLERGNKLKNSPTEKGNMGKNPFHQVKEIYKKILFHQ